MKTSKRGVFRALLMCLVLVLTFSVCSMTAFAASSNIDAKTKLRTCIYNANADKSGGSTATANVKDGAVAIVDKKYTRVGGGEYSYKDVVTSNGVVNDCFTQLTSSAQSELLNDMNTVADAVLDQGTIGGVPVTEDTKNNWLQDLQQCNGVGSKLMNALTSDLKPDFVSAKTIISPFNGIFGTVLGIGAILIMAFLVLTMVLDLSYMCIPAFRMMLSGDKDDGKGGGSKIKVISHEAVSAVEIAEGGQGQSGQSGGQNKVAVGIYFKKRVIMLVILGICLLYLISGQIFGLVGMILDLVSGFFHA